MRKGKRDTHQSYYGKLNMGIWQGTYMHEFLNQSESRGIVATTYE